MLYNTSDDFDGYMYNNRGIYVVQVLIEAKTSDGEVHSILLQNAETVKLVGPAAAGNGPGGVCTDWEAIAVSQLNVGDTVYVLRQGAARHTGVAIKERITER